MITSGQGSWGLEFQKIRSITHFPTLDDLLVALSDGRVDAAVHEAKSLQAHLAKSTGKLYPEHIVLASSPSRTIYVGFEFPIGSPFRLPINRALQALRDAGHLHDQQVSIL
jgi:ABC-type amino acid transport substrate-binding protein